MPDVFWLAHESGGVKETLVLVDFVQIVVEALPHFAVIVWEKLVDFLVTVTFSDVPSVPFPTDRVDFRGIVLSVNVEDPVAFTLDV